MRPNGRFVATLVSRAWQQSSSASRRFDAHRCTSHPGVQLSRRLFSSQGTGAAGEGASQRKAIARAFPFWDRSNSFRAIIVGVAASGCLGVLVVAADAKSSKEDALIEQPTKETAVKTKPRIVVLGTGWAGMSFIKDLDPTLYDIQVVSPRNHFVFTPLLPSVTNGTVEARSIAEPIRRMFKNVRLYEAECISIDPEKKQLLCQDVSDVVVKGRKEFVVDYDYLVIAVGGLSNTFGTEGVKEYCHFLKELEDAERIRQTVIDCFETASLPHLTDDEREHMLSFLIVGGGPTGVEFAAELHDLVHEDLASLYPSVQKFISVKIIQSGDHILNTFDDRISKYAEKKFKRDGVEVKVNCRVMKVTDGHVLVKEKATGQEVEVPFGMAVWSTGLGTRPCVSKYMEKIGQADRRMLATDEWLRVKGDHSAWALGDCATIEQRKVMEDIEGLFHKADVDNSGTLTVKEFKDVMELVKERYPQIVLYMQRQHFHGFVDFIKTTIAAGKQHEVELSLEQFKTALSKVDSQMKQLPATAQVAAQQGSYLAKCFNHFPNRDELPEGPMRVRGEGRHRFHQFQYRHFGQFAPLGTEQCGAELPGDWVSVGRSTQWLWYSVYASFLASYCRDEQLESKGAEFSRLTEMEKVPLKDCKLTNKYENIKSTINSGLSVLRVTDKFVETKANARFKKEEFFRRIKPALLIKIVEESKVQVLLLDLRDTEDYQLCRIKGAISYPAVNLKKSVNYFSADILSCINKEPDRIIVIYDDEEHVMASAGNLFFEKGVDNIFVLHGGLKEVVSKYSYILEGKYPKPVAPLRSICNTTTNGRRTASSNSSTPNWIRKNKELCSGLSTPASKGDKQAKQRPGWGFPRSSSVSVSYSDTSSSQRGFSPIKR